MDIDLPIGKYVVAVSGGIDSVVLLHLLTHKLKNRVPQQLGELQLNPGFNASNMLLTVAHFDHGMRPDSESDREFVQKLTESYGLPFVYDRVELGKGASEATARDARYAFLQQVRKKAGADAIVTAHHQDDVLETIIINWLRGTRSRGLSSLRSTDVIRRPLLGITKKQIRNYARDQKLEWREDSTNADETYLRNYVRSRIMLRLSDADRMSLLKYSAEAARLNDSVKEIATDYLATHATLNSLERKPYILLPEVVAREILTEWLRRCVPVSVTTKLIERLDTAIRSGRNNSLVDIGKGFSMHLGRSEAELIEPPKAQILK